MSQQQVVTAAGAVMGLYVAGLWWVAGFRVGVFIGRVGVCAMIVLELQGGWRYDGRYSLRVARPAGGSNRQGCGCQHHPTGLQVKVPAPVCQQMHMALSKLDC